MVGVTTAIYTIARLGRAAGLTDDVHTVTARDPTTFHDFAQVDFRTSADMTGPVRARSTN